MNDTIFALASGRGRAGVAVLRVSGPGAGAALHALTGRDLPPARRAGLREFRDPGNGEILDRGLALWFPAPRSYTGEDMVELHVHAGSAVIEGIAQALSGLAFTRPAEPGEFTRRAFLNGKMDLTAAEGVADVVAAETAAQRRQALRQMDGALGRLYEDWRARLVRALAHFEAAIDFPDEDLPAGVAVAARAAAGELERDVRRHLADGQRGERLREGVSVAILGPPNAGKSTLLNLLSQRDAAIVSPIAGTTRDVIDIDMDLDGYPVRIADTAGLRRATDAIEAEGVRRARKRAEAADLKIVVLDATAWPAVDAAAKVEIDAGAVVLLNKIDLRAIARPALVDGKEALPLSLATGAGCDEAREAIAARVRALADTAGAPALTRARHRAALQACAEALARVQTAAMPELAAEDLRLAGRALGRITGRVEVEELLDAIFRDFCIGK
ncbi:MAG: tRNA uridine-5-carboxymethylaminomethyl(34) synthesis GTPase MnmE [Rhodospirillales bacterium]